MRKALGCLVLIVFLILGYFFLMAWRNYMPQGVGTGNIGGRSEPASRQPSQRRSMLRQIAEEPEKFEGKRVTVTGRVRGTARYASNRNLYRLAENDYRLVIVDDKSPPKEYALRTITGVVQVIKPPLGNGYAYIVSVKGDPKIELDWQDVQAFFTEKLGDIKQGVQEATRE